MNEHKKSGKLLKRLLVVCLCLVMALGSAVTIIAASFDGDLNGDGKVTALDAQMLAEYEAGLRDLDLSDKIGLTVKSIIDWILGRTASEPNLDEGIEAVVEVKTENGEVTKEVSFTDGILSVTVREGTKVTGETLTVSVKKLTSSESDVALEEGQELLPLDIHVEGVAADNTTPIIIGVAGALDAAMNEGNLELYHVENGVAQPMNQVESAEALSAHNDFYYDPVNGDITVSMATFSEVAMVSDTDKAWEGHYDYSWYTAYNEALAKRSGNDADYIIANADQLAAFGAIVGGMDGQTQDSFKGKTVVLAADINLGDKESENNPNIIFYPIGYNSDDGKYEKTGVAVSTGFYTFQGTFDGQGHTISNFYQNTWEMKGDNNYYDATLQYYRDGMGLFGKVYGGTVKNLTVENFSSDGEYTTTGVIAAYADGATFENIAITNCNPRVYNIGNGGIVGCVGWYATEADLKTTFTNITVDNSNKISALWGSWDVACGGIVGQYYPTSGQSSANKPANAGIRFENCHVAAQMDVYNDVCANYQYYAYRYTGMMIGSIRENLPADANGYVYPKMDGITAEGCTVHFGDWNDYYYCELVANSLASYTHDHQFSRLEQVAAVDVENMTVTSLKGETTAIPTSGRYNYVVVEGEHATDHATCYHFVDGKVHDHDDYNGDGEKDYETVNGEQLLVENNRHIYLEFDQLFTGYGWGVTSKGLTDFVGIENMDIAAGDHDESVVKFEKTNITQVNAGKAIKLNQLFSAVEGCEVAIVPENIQVAVTDLTEDEVNITATLNKGFQNWEDYELTFTGTGDVQLTIQDYYFCTPTTINVTITERANEQKFELVFPNTTKYLYRVGNQNTVTLSSLFKAKDGAEIGTVSVTVEPVDTNVAVSGTYTAGTTTWDAGTIQFTGTGVVKVTITDNDYCIPTELLLEVVDATNLTNATGTTTGGNFVLLCDVNASGYVYYWNATLYGNGFTYSLKNAPTNYSSSHGHGVLITQNATLDNLVIVGDIYDEYGAYTNNNDYNAAIDVLGETVIQNCYISGCSAPVSTRANATIKNTTLYGGAVANLIIKGGTVTLENVTTANYDDGRYDNELPIGMGIVIHSDAAESAKLVLNGTLTQYNFIAKSKTPSDNYAVQLHNTMFDSSCSQYQFSDSTDTYVNTGIISLTANFVIDGTDNDNVEDNANTGYVAQEVSASGFDGYVYTQLNTSGAVNNNYNQATDTHVATTQGAVPPNYNFDYTTKNYVAKTEGSNYYCYEENGIVNISMDDGDTFNWDTSILTVTKGNQTLDYTVSMNGTDYTGKSIAFNTAGDYKIVYTYTDVGNYELDENGNITTYSETYTKTVNISVAVIKATTKHAEFVMGNNTETEKITIDNATYISAKGVTEDGTAWGSMTINGRKVYYPITEASISKNIKSETQATFYVFDDIVTITDYQDGGTGAEIVYNADTTAIPTNLTVVKGKYGTVSSATSWYTSTTDSALTQTGYAQVFKYAASNEATQSTSDACYLSPSGLAAREAYYTLAQYKYVDMAGTTYYYYVGYSMADQKSSDSDNCVTGDTLITLADGSQVRVDALTGEEELLVWNLETGSYDTAPIVFVDSEEEAEYEVVNLHFSDGSKVGVVYEHGFFDLDLGKYVYLDAYNAESYIGHTFVTQGDIKAGTWNTATLTDVVIEKEVTKVYSPVTFSHLCYYTDGVLSMPGGIEGLFNIFDVDTSIMAYDAEKKAADIETYGLFTLEDFGGMITEEAFYAFNGAYLKVAMAKGLLTWEDIAYMAERYIPLM